MTVDAEQLLSVWLRANEDVTELVADRIYTELPRDKMWPAVRITRYDGRAVHPRPRWLEEVNLQVEVFGGRKTEAYDIADTIAQLVADELVGGHDLGVVTWVGEIGNRYLPDDTFRPAKPRYILDFPVRTRPVITGS